MAWNGSGGNATVTGRESLPYQGVLLAPFTEKPHPDAPPGRQDTPPGNPARKPRQETLPGVSGMLKVPFW